MDFVAELLKDNLELLTFAYGGVFLLLGTVILSQRMEGSPFRLTGFIWLFGVFCLVHGLSNWLCSWMLLRGFHPVINGVRVAGMAASYLFLFEFGRRLLLCAADRYDHYREFFGWAGWWLYAALAGTAALSVALFGPETGLRAWTAYGLSVTSMFFAAAGTLSFAFVERSVLGRANALHYLILGGVSLVALAIAGVAGSGVSTEELTAAGPRQFDDGFTVLAIALARVLLACLVAVSFVGFVAALNRHHHRSMLNALEEGSKHYQMILDAAGEGIMELNRKGVITFANPAAAGMVGYEPEELKGKFYHALIQHSRAEGETYAPSESPVLHAIRNGESRRGDDQFFWNREGSCFPIEYTCTPIETQHGEKGTVLTFSNISQRLKLDRLLRETQVMAKVGGWEFDPVKDRMSWTDEVYRIHELRPGSSVDLEKAIRHFHHDSQPVIREAIRQGIETGQSFDLELELVTAKDQLIWVRVVGKALRRDGGSYLLSGTLQDIKDRRRSEQALRDNRDFYELILDTVPIRIAYVDRDLAIRYLNKAYADWFQRPREALLGQPIDAVVTPEAFDEIKPRIDEVLHGERVGFKASAERDGQQRHLDVYYLPNVSREGEVVGFFSVVQDVTEHEVLEEKLVQAQKMEAVGQLTGGVAHDFNNLLGVILGNLQLLERPLRDDEKLHKKVKTATRAAMRGADLTRRLLAFSRRQVLEPKVVDLNSLVSGLDDLLRRTLGESVDVATVFAGNLWMTMVDPSQLENAIVNLAINARDAMPEGGKLTIETCNAHVDREQVGANSELKSGDYVIVAVSDSGVGIPKDLLPQVFEPFFTTKEVGKGSGLGLSMVYGFVEQSGGCVTVYSEEGHGTTVKLYLPRAEAETTDAREETAIHRFMPGGEETILVVEDEDDVRETVVSLLTELGYRILEACDGNDALDLLESGVDIDLMLTDVMMPGGMHGPVLAERAHELRPELKVLFTSGYAQSAIMHRGALVKGRKFIGKPYKNEELALKIRMMMDREAEDVRQSKSSAGY